MRKYLLILGLLWSGGLISADSLGIITLKDKDFFSGVFGGAVTALSLNVPTASANYTKKKP